MENLEEWARKHVKCCACGCKLDTSEVLNICATKKAASWLFPVCGNLERPGYLPRAVAFVCEECMNNKVKIRHVVEWKGLSGLVTYHDIDSLEDADVIMSKIQYYFGKQFRRKQLTWRGARQEGVN